MKCPEFRTVNGSTLECNKPLGHSGPHIHRGHVWGDGASDLHPDLFMTCGHHVSCDHGDGCGWCKALQVLRDFSTPHDCGCSPICRCQSQAALEAELEEIREFAKEALKEQEGMRHRFVESDHV